MKQGPYSLEMMIHFDDGDPGGITFFPHYFRLSERAFELGLLLHKIDWKDWFDHPEWGVPLRHAEAEFMKPLRPGQMCRVHQGVLSLGDSSLKLQSDFYSAQGDLCARVKTTHVFVDKKTLRKRSIPLFLREYLQAKLIS